MTGMNRLKDSASAYLRSAAHQPIHWYEWGDEAFEAAKAQDKPVLLDIGAVWCHWCHVIDRESYEDAGIAELINGSFIPVKVDVDARPDIDRRYQEVVQALTGQGGWPLTVFLTPDAQVIYGGTYFPPEDRWGMPGLKTVLQKVSETYRGNKAEVVAQAQRLHEELARIAAQNFRSEFLSPQILDRILADMKNSFDEEYGGFGDSPKFPPSTALELLLRRAAASGDKKTLSMVTRTLDRMESGGLRDQLGGAFHRYSTDRFWRVPHFEVMLYANSELLKIYSDAYRLTRESRYARVVEELIGYLRETLSDQQQGGFYGSQDADSTLHDDGDYWTWTVKEASAVLNPQEMELARRYYGIEEQGEMRENPAKNVLYQTQPLDAKIRKLLSRVQEKLLAARRKRKAPVVDKAIYVNWNGLMISGMLSAAVALDDENAQSFALKTLDRIWRDGYRPGDGLFHVIQGNAAHTRGFLDDYAYLLAASLDAYEVSQKPEYLQRARQLAEEMIAAFWDDAQGGFFDIRAGQEKMDILRQRRKPIQDAPTPSANSVAALGFNRLFQYTGDPKYRGYAERTLSSFAGSAQDFGLFAAGFGVALDAFFQEPVKVVILGRNDDPKTRVLVKSALSPYRPDRVLQVVDPSGNLSNLPGSVREIVKGLGPLREPTALVCAGTQCAPPATKPEQLRQLLESFGVTKSAVND